VLAIHNLCFLDYGPFTFSVDNQTGISIQGRSGSGKSLLLRAIADLDRHDGQVSLQGQQQDEIAAYEWRQQVGYLMADAIFWADSVAEHFLKPIDSPFLKQAAERLRVDSLLEAPVANLSSGEKQRLALLRLLANQPRALMLDEPTSHLDEDSTLAFEAIINEYRQIHGSPLILVSHDTSQCKRLASSHYLLQDNSLQEISL
jgi:ABC-type iron transport system FetAB ATPase subunit